MQRGHKSHPAGEEKYQFHYGSEQFVNVEDRPVNDELFKVLHGLLMQTEAPQKYPVVQLHHYHILAGDQSTSPEELVAIEEKDVGEIILALVAKNPNTPLETLEKLAKYDNKFIRRSVQVNAKLNMRLAIELFVDNPRDELIYTRGHDQLIKFMNDGKITIQAANQIWDNVMSRRGQKVAAEEKPIEDIAHLYEHKIKIRIKR